MLKEDIRDLRQASHELVPILLEQLGLQEAIHDFCNLFSHLGLEISCDGFEGQLEKQLELAIYRIVQELVNNIVKHSSARRARIEMFKEGGQLIFEAQDNGKGLETNSRMRKGIGLKTIDDRVKLLGEAWR